MITQTRPRRKAAPARAAALLALASALFGPAAAAGADPEDLNTIARAEFRRAMEALDRNEPATDAAADSPLLRDYLLYPYLEAQRLREPLQLGRPTDDAAVAALLARDGDAPWTRELRRDWLLDLARREQWGEFLRHYFDARADARLRCEQQRGLIASLPPGPMTDPITGSTPDPGPGPGPQPDLAAATALQPRLLALWTTGAQLPDACVGPFDWARAQGWFTPERLRERARLALLAGNADLADFLLRPLPPELAPELRRWSQLLQAPERELDRLSTEGATAIGAQDPAAIAAAVTRLARRDPATAATRVAALLAACGTGCALASPATAGELRREVALGYAWSRLPQAPGAFRTVDPVALDERAHEWRVRSALWARDWEQARDWIAAMPATLAAQPRWRYWKARALAATGDAQASALYETLSRENGYYALLAAGQLGRGYKPTATAVAADPALQSSLLQQPAVQRARELWLAGRNDASSLEWGEWLATLDPTRAAQAAQLPGRWNAWAQTVAAASRAQVFDDYALLYPRPFEAEVQAASQLAKVPAQWIYAVMRQESLYDPRARSRASALGLLQMLPSTARETARRNAQPAPAAEALYDPVVNTRLGALHLRELLDRYDGEFVLVLGAYNAGPRPVARWRPAAGALPADVWIENVPYNETRSYIQRVIWHSAVFGWRATGQAQSASALLRPITPDDGAATALDTP